MTTLIIVESPAKCQKIQSFLGLGYKVLASKGHIRHLKEDLDAVGLDRDFEPTFEFMKEKAQAIDQLKAAAKGATRFILASDDDREGELIAYSVCLLLKLDPKTTPRAVFHEITKTAVTQAVENPRFLDMNKVNAAQARAVLDMMVGFTMSPLLWKSIGPALSAGRCQTPALRLVVDREDEIGQFTSTSSWKVHGQWSTGKEEPWPAALTDELEDQESATTYLEIHHNKPKGTILTADTTNWSQNPPLPLITSTLQQQASSLFRSPPKKTMQIAQRLYEAGHITYMRTDKAVLSEEAVKEAQDWVRATHGDAYIVEGKKKPKRTSAAKQEVKAQEAHEISSNKKKSPANLVTQGAHEAIRPTHMNVLDLPSTEDWSAVDRKVYGLIWLKAVQSVMAPAKGLQRTITFVADGDDKDDFQWRASWRKTTFEGWRKIATRSTTTEEEQAEEESQEAQWTMAEGLKPGTALTWSTLAADPHETKAPGRYTEATLVRELETRGIGRPSTFASLISTLLEKEYAVIKSFEAREQTITKLSLPKPKVWPPHEEQVTQKVGAEKDRLAPTPLGLSVLNYLTQHFDDLFQYGFTASMESRLDKIAEGQEPWKQVLRDTWTSYKDRYTTLKAAKGTATRSGRREFGDGLTAITTKKGPLLLREDPDGDKNKTIFYGWPASMPTLEAITEDEVKAHVAKAQQEQQGELLGEHEGQPVLRKVGKFGPYVTWNGRTLSCQATDTITEIVAKLTTQASSAVRVVGQFEIRNGPYGPYMFKKALTGPSRKFVSVPKSLDLDTVTEADLIAVFQQGLQSKARSGGYKKSTADGETSAPTRGGRGGRGGRGRGRGRGNWRGKA